MLVRERLRVRTVHLFNADCANLLCPGFTVGSMEGYKDPANHQAMHNWDLLMQRNCQTLHLTGVLTVLKDFVATLPAASEA